MRRKIAFICVVISLLYSCKKDEVDEKVNTTLPERFFAQLSNIDLLEFDLAIDKNDDIYVSGTTSAMTEGADLDFGGVILKAGGNRDAFIVKYDQAGKVLWAKLLGDNSQENGLTVGVDHDENVYVACRFRDSTTIEGTKFKTKTLRNSSGIPNWDDLLLVKLDKNGKHTWTKQISGVGFETLSSIEISEDGKIFVSGEFYQSIYFDKITYNVNGSAFFVACYNPTGELGWAKTYGADHGLSPWGDIYSSNMKLSRDGKIIIAGSFEGQKKIEQTMLNSNGDQDIFITKLDRQGRVEWVKTFGSVGTENCRGLSIDEDGNISIGGFFRGPLILGPYSFKTPTASGDAILAKFNSTGSLIWASQITGNEDEYIYDLVARKSKLYTVGYFGSVGYFGDSTLQGQRYTNTFFAEYTDSGKFEKVQTLGSYSARGRRILVDRKDFTIVLGYFGSPYTFNNSVYANKSVNDIFLVKF
ncbi:hypothetical protein [Dyadobacter sp. LHD-138]|uniref:hypothetical protein n=1 Tax=Dyadobacter sp. LHD-138 TaxID=3071413 RepID=UPI0027E06606|nr:hypothetical protein [Dyadobacter sp. LHD-138]MDQ6480681.1 hypothetical protein [Dyadobacter sp. LHD-138]